MTADEYAAQVSTTMRFHGETYIGNREFSTITAAIKTAFADGVKTAEAQVQSLTDQLTTLKAESKAYAERAEKLAADYLTADSQAHENLERLEAAERRAIQLQERARDLKECRKCQWPVPKDDDYYICPCCGFEASVDDPERYQWDGKTFWAKDDERKPAILIEAERQLTSLQAGIAELETTYHTAANIALDAAHQAASNHRFELEAKYQLEVRAYRDVASRLRLLREAPQRT